MATRSTFLSVTFNGAVLTNTLSAFCRYSWHQNVPEATVYVPSDPFPGSQPYDQAVTIAMGAGNNINRFKGVFRRYDFSLYPRQLGLVFRGNLVRALEYQNHSDPQHKGGMLLEDLLGAGNTTGTDQAVISAVLSLAGLSGSINGTGVTWGSRSDANVRSFMWRAGTSDNMLLPLAGAGQSALDYIQQWDQVSAVTSGGTGFYRTYETVNGIFRSLIGGRPRGSIDVPAFSEGIDIEPGAQSSREYPLANACYVSGFDTGLTAYGPVRNQAFDATTSANTGTFLGQQSNPFMPSSRPVTYDFGSPMIEWGTEAESGVGMNCERVANALLADLNRETVRVRFRTWRDDLITPGMTILVQGPGGQPDRLGMGEKLWVDEVTTGIDANGQFYQEIAATGGGPPDTSTPAPPG